MTSISTLSASSTVTNVLDIQIRQLERGIAQPEPKLESRLDTLRLEPPVIHQQVFSIIHLGLERRSIGGRFDIVDFDTIVARVPRNSIRQLGRGVVRAI